MGLQRSNQAFVLYEALLGEGGRRGAMDCGFCFPFCSRTPGRLSFFLVSCPACHKAPVRSSDCGVGCLIALCTEESWDAFILWCQECSDSPGMPQDVVSNAPSTVDVFECLRIWCFPWIRLASSLSQQKGPGRRGLVFTWRGLG